MTDEGHSHQSAIAFIHAAQIAPALTCDTPSATRVSQVLSDKVTLSAGWRAGATILTQVSANAFAEIHDLTRRVSLGQGRPRHQNAKPGPFEPRSSTHWFGHGRNDSAVLRPDAHRMPLDGLITHARAFKSSRRPVTHPESDGDNPRARWLQRNAGLCSVVRAKQA